VSGAGGTVQTSVTRTADNAINHEVALPAGKAGTLSTRTDADTGICTVASGHGITTSHIVDVHWDGGVQYGCTVTAQDATTISIDSGSGDDLPTQDTAIVVTAQVTINTLIDGDNVALLAIKAAYTGTPDTITGCHVDMQDSGNATIEEIDCLANLAKYFDITGGDTNVFTGNPIVEIYASNGDATNAATLTILAVQDSTP